MVAKGQGLKVKRRIAKHRRAQAQYPNFDWAEYRKALARQAGTARRALGNQTREERRLGAPPVTKKIATKEVKPVTAPTIVTTDDPTQDQDLALLAQGKALIEATSPYDEYKAAVWAAYQGNKSLQPAQLKALATISHRYGLNPNPGLDLIYGWVDGGKFNVHISYKGWLALARRFKRFVYRTYRVEEEEVLGRGGATGDIIVLCEVIDFETAEKVKELKELGFEIDTNDYKIIGAGIWKKGTNVAKGRDGEWTAKKRAVKDAMVQLVSDKFNISPPEVDGLYYDHESGTWVMPVNSSDPSDSVPQLTDVTPAAPDKPAPHWTTVQNWSAFWVAARDMGLTRDEVHEALGVKSVKDFKGTREECDDRLKVFADAKQEVAEAKMEAGEVDDIPF